MARIQAFEFNESAWCPRVVRDSIVEALGRGLRWGRIYDAAGPVFAEFVARTGCRRVLDLCTGTGEPVSILLDALARGGHPSPEFALSDLFPNVAAMDSVAARHPGKVHAIGEPVDATDVPASLEHDARTVVSAFHHFPPELAARILADSVRSRRPVFILEAFPRSLGKLGAVMPAMTLAMLANPVLARRDRLLKAVLTYLLPVIPAAGLFDAVVSALRIHGEADLRAMVAPFGEEWHWEWREVPFFPGGRACAFFGLPRTTA